MRITPEQRGMLARMHAGLDAERLTAREIATCDALVRRGLARMEIDLDQPCIYWLTEDGQRERIKHLRLR